MFRVVEDFIGSDRLMTMIGGKQRVRKQARVARAGARDIIVATPGRVMQLVSMNIIRWVVTCCVIMIYTCWLLGGGGN